MAKWLLDLDPRDIRVEVKEDNDNLWADLYVMDHYIGTFRVNKSIVRKVDTRDGFSVYTQGMMVFLAIHSGCTVVWCKNNIKEVVR